MPSYDVTHNLEYQKAGHVDVQGFIIGKDQ